MGDFSQQYRQPTGPEAFNLQTPPSHNIRAEDSESEAESQTATVAAAASTAPANMAASSRRGQRQERLEAQMVAVTETLKVMMEELKLMKETMKKEEAPTSLTPSGPPTHGPGIQPEGGPVADAGPRCVAPVW